MLKRPWVIAIWLLALIILQVTVLPHLLPFNLRPDPLLVFATLTGFIGGPSFGSAVGAIGGLVIDMLSGRFVGLHVLTQAVAGCGGGLLTRHVYRDNAPVALLAVSVATVAQELLALAVIRAAGITVPLSRSLAFLPTLISLNLAAAVFLYPIMLRQSRGLPVPGSEDDTWTIAR